MCWSQERSWTKAQKGRGTESGWRDESKRGHLREIECDNVERSFGYASRAAAPRARAKRPPDADFLRALERPRPGRCRKRLPPLRLRQRRNDFSPKNLAREPPTMTRQISSCGKPQVRRPRMLPHARISCKLRSSWSAVSCCARIRARARATWHAHVRDAVRNSGSACRRPLRRLVSKGSVSDP